jgi:hypothetical protein
MNDTQARYIKFAMTKARRLLEREKQIRFEKY